MFKKITVFAIALLLVTGCSKDEAEKVVISKKAPVLSFTELKIGFKKRK